jgi:signal transduction histidine kinase
VPAYLDSILSNLISNSIKYKADHRTPIILIATEENNSDATIIVHDNGIGFDSKLFNHKLFEPFQRFHTHKDGKGLGMFLVKTQVIAMNGTIVLTSEPDVGTHVIITLPKT